MKKFNMLALAIILSLCFIFASTCGANVKKTEIAIQAGDTVHAYVVKYFPNINPSDSAYQDIVDFNNSHNDYKIGNPDFILAGKTIVIALAFFAENDERVSEATEIEIKSDQVEESLEVQNLDDSIVSIKTKSVHVVVAGDTIYSLVEKYYSSSKLTVKNFKALADFNKISYEFSGKEGIFNIPIYVGQKLNIPNILLLEQISVGLNPTTGSTVEAVRKTIKQMNLSANEAGLDIFINEAEAESIANHIAKSNDAMVLNGKTVLAATFSDYVQGITKITAEEELSGKYITVSVGDYEIHFVIAKQCNNVYAVVEGYEEESFALSPLSMGPSVPYLLPIDTVNIKASPVVDYRFLTCLPEFDVITGTFLDKPVTGGYVDGYWSTSDLWFNSCDDWQFGIAYITRNWAGESGDETPYEFYGNVRMWGVETRWTNENWHLMFRVATGERNDTGGFSNEFVDYSSVGYSELYNIYSSIEYRDYSDAWFSKIRLTLEGEWADKDSQWRDDKMFAYWNNSIINTDVDPENQSTFWAIITADVYDFDKERNFVLISETGYGYQWNHHNNSFSFRTGIHLFGGIKLLMGYTFNTSEAVADTRNIFSVEFYPLGTYLGMKRFWSNLKIITEKSDTKEEIEKSLMERRKKVRQQIKADLAKQ